MADDTIDRWKVVINDEEQYALLPDAIETPDGWYEAGFAGTEESCVAYVDEHWTDLRPRSLREAMDR